MRQSLPNDILSLAAVLQAVSLVDGIAFTGKVKDNVCFKASIYSLFEQTNDDVAAIYSSVDNLKLGIDNLELYLSRDTRGEDFTNRVRYMTQLNRLAIMLSDNQKMAENIGEALAEANKHKKSVNSLVTYLAKTYYDNFSSLPTKNRIVVLGKKENLKIEKNVNMIRALLFAGVRASLLWREHGYGVLSLLLRRKKMLRQIIDSRAK